METLKETSQGRVVKDYRSAYPDPLVLRTGEKVTVEKKKTEWDGWLWCTTEKGKKGWVPEKYLEIEGSKGRACRDYDGTELTAAKGESLEIFEEESGWIWCRTEHGRYGWIPEENVRIESRKGESG